MKSFVIAAPLLLCASLAAAQPVDLQKEVSREVEDQFGDRLQDLEFKSNLR